MNEPQTLDWQIPYKKNISAYADSAGIRIAETFSEKDAQKILIKIVDDYKEGKLPIDELAMTCEILSSMSPEGSDVYWALLDASEIEWYQSNEPDKVKGFLDSLLHYYEKLKQA